MSFAKTYSAQTVSLNAHIIDIEVDISRGLHAFSIVGLPDKAVEESRDRFSAAIKHAGFKSPKSRNQKVVIALAPADLKKEGPNFDLGIALAYLNAVGDISFDPNGKLFLGELSLDGSLRPIRGALPLVQKAREDGFTQIFVPAENAEEAAIVNGVEVHGVYDLADVVAHLNKESSIWIERQPKTEYTYTPPVHLIDFSDIRGQETAKRGLEIAAAGRHNIALHGPPGTGKTMLAKAFTGILPPLSFDEALEVTGIHSVAGTLRENLILHPPLRAPHHTSSYVSLVGGGAIPKPGDITLAHRGVLFLDEFPEFDRRVLEALRQPLEDKIVSVSRARGSAEFPASVILLAAMNPCPCGYYDSATRSCTCTPANIERYRRKLSGPIMDRIDLWLPVGEISHEKLSEKRSGENTSTIKERVARAQERQRGRFKDHHHIRANSDMSVRELETFVPLATSEQQLLNQSATKLGLSARAYHKVIKLARTIADLDNEEVVGKGHILEALQYRPQSALGTNH